MGIHCRFFLSKRENPKSFRNGALLLLVDAVEQPDSIPHVVCAIQDGNAMIDELASSVPSETNNTHKRACIGDEVDLRHAFISTL